MSVLKSVFGPAKDEIWSQIANEIGGEFIDGGFWNQTYLEYKYKEWTLILDTHSTSNNRSTETTRMRAPFVNKDGLYFNIYEENIFSPIGKLLGMQDIQIGDSFFDDRFIIKGNRPEKIKQLMDSDRIRQLFSNVKGANMKIRDKEFNLFKQSFPAGVDLLHFEIIGVIKDKTTLKNLFLLFCAVLERLVQIDSAYEDDPNISLK